MRFEDRLFQEAELEWDLEKIYRKLCQAKQLNTSRDAKLTPTEKAILRGFLCNYSPQEIAIQLHWKLNSLRVELSRGFYRYVETITDRDLNTVKNWRNIVQWLEEKGYKTSPLKQSWSQIPNIFSVNQQEHKLSRQEKKNILDKLNSQPVDSSGNVAQEVLKEIILANFNYLHAMSERYRDNPLVLKLLATTIQELLDGIVVQLFEVNSELDPVVETLFQELLRNEIENLSILEKQIVCTLAINRQEMSLKQLQQFFEHQVKLSTLLPSLRYLKQRSLIQVLFVANKMSFTLPSKVATYLLTQEQDLFKKLKRKFANLKIE